MTTADFVAALFWPLAILFVALLKHVRDPVLRPRIANIAGATLVLYCVLALVYWGSSLLAILVAFSAGAVGGAGMVWLAWLRFEPRGSMLEER